MKKKEELNTALVAAMKSKDETRKIPLRLVMAAVKLAEIESKSELDDAGVISLIQKEVKARRESIADAEKAGRDDLVAAAQAEMEVLQEFLPEELSEEQLKKIVQEAVAEAGASSPADMGNVMKVLMPKVKGRADGSLVSRLVKQALEG